MANGNGLAGRYRAWRAFYLGLEIDRAMGDIDFCTRVIAKGKSRPQTFKERDRAQMRLGRLTKRLNKIVQKAV
jgi:hypothetical protein